MSDTPRTNAILTAILETHGHVGFLNCPPTWVAFARELERELNAANNLTKQLETTIKDLQEIIEYQRKKIDSLEYRVPIK